MISRSYIDTIDQNWEYVVFGIYASGLGLSTILLIGMFAEAFAGRSPLKFTIIRLLSVVPVLNIVSFLAIILGAYFGLLVLLFLDKKKRPQSVLFLVVSVIALLGFLLTGLFFEFAGPVEIPAFVVGIISVLFTFGGDTLRDVELNVNPNSERIVDLPRQEPIEFPNAERAMVYLLSAFVLIAVIEAHTRRQALIVLNDGVPVPNLSVFSTVRYVLADPPSWLQFIGAEATTSLYLLGTIGFLGFTKLFVGYDAEKRVVFIGPTRSGKTHCILGCFMEAQNNNLARNPSGDLLSYREQFVQNRTWIPPTENEANRLRFEYSIGTFFKRNVVIDGLDYPGEYSRYIADGLRLVNEMGMYIPNHPDDTPPDDYITHHEAAAHETTEECQEFLRLVADKREDIERKNIEIEPNDEGGYELGGNIREDIERDFNVIFELMISEILPRVRNADVLVYMFDSLVHKRIAHEDANLPDESRREVAYYQRITSLQNKHNRTSGVLSKADKLEDEFQAQNPGKRIYRDYETDFRPWLETDILAGPFADVVRAEEINPIPVFFLEEESNHPGEDTKPLVDRGQPQYKGFQQLLEEFK